MKTLFKTLFALFVIALLYLLFFPSDIEPVSYTPPKNPGFTGVFERNNQLAEAKKILSDISAGPEAIVQGADSMLYTGLADGSIIRFSKDGKTSSTFAKTEGRPLGMKFDKNNNLIVADEFLGLLSVDTLGKITVLTDEVDGTKIFFADDLDITAEGMIYFTDASQRNHDVEKEIWELQPTGRLLSYNPNNKLTKVEMEGMRFANGVTLGPNDEYLLVNETFGMKINKYWLKGTKTGQTEIFNNELPCFPDNITYNGNGTFWLSFPNRRIGDDFESVYEKPYLRKILRKLPSALTAQEPPPFGMIIGLNESGEVTHNYQDTTGTFHDLTSVVEIDGDLYLGSLKMSSVGKFELNK